MGQVFVSILQINAAVFDPDTEFTGQINAGFCGTDRTHRNGFRIGSIGAGTLMDFQTQAVTVAMTEIFAVAGIGDDLPGSGIHIPANDTGPGNGKTLLCQTAIHWQ